MDELFEALTLIQTAKVRNFPVVLFGTDYWGGLLSWIREVMLTEGKISPEDLSLLVATDSPEEAVRVVIESQQRREPPAGSIAGTPVDPDKHAAE